MQISGDESPEKLFHEVRFVLFGFDPVKEHKIRSKLLEGGAIDAVDYGLDCNLVIVDKLVYNDPICVAARRDGKTLVTSLWVEHSFDLAMLADTTNPMYLPVRDVNGIPGARGMVMCLTGYVGQDRVDIMTMVGLMGATFSKPLVATKVTHLICYKFEGEKYELAKRMKKIKLVNHHWLEDCLKAWDILPEDDYIKSGIELEMEAEAKDSEDETEDVASKTDKERNNIFYRQMASAEKKSSHQSSAKLDVSRKSLSLSASISSAKVRNSRNIPSSSGKEINIENTSLPQEDENKHLDMAGFSSARSPGNTPSKHLEMDGICNTKSPGNMSSDMRTIPGQEIDFEKASVLREAHQDQLKLTSSVGARSPRNTSSEVSSNTRYGTVVSEKVDHALTSASGSTKKSPNGQVSKSSSKIPCTIRSKSPRTQFPNVQSNTMDGTLVSEKAEHVLASASESAKKSSIIELSKLSSKSYYRSPPRKSDLPLRMEGSSASPSASNVSKPMFSGGSHMSLERLQDENVAGVETPSRGTLPHLDGKTASHKGKTPVSRRKTKSPLSNQKVKSSLGTKLVAKIPELLASGSLIDGSHAVAVDVSSKTVASHSENGVQCAAKEAVNISVTTEDKQKGINQVLQPSMEGLEKSTSSNSDLNGHSSCRTNSLIAEVEMHESDGSPIPGTNPRAEKIGAQADVNHSKAGRSGSQLKAAKKEKMFVKKLGSRPTTFKTAKRKGSIKLQKAVLQSECITRSKETIGMEEDNGNNIVSEKVEKVPAAANEDFLAGAETEAPNDSGQSECNEGHNKSKCAEDKASHVGEGVVHRKSQVDQEVLPTNEPLTKSLGEVSMREAEKAICSERIELDELNTTGNAEEKKVTKGKKRTLTKSKENQLNDPGHEEKRSELNSKRDERKAVSVNEEEAVPLAGKTKTRTHKKAKRSHDVEKENKPVTVKQKTVRNDAEASVEKGTRQQKKTPLREESKADKANTNSMGRAEKLEMKTEPASWFILSGHRLQRKEFQKVIKQLKGRVCRDSHNWSYQATHFIVPDPIRRTEKFFAAAASGSWILKTDYLTSSNEARRFLSEEPYEWHKKGLSEDGAINLEAPRKWRLLKKRTGHGAFYGMKIVVYGECIAPPLDTLKRVIKAGDGTILATSPPYTRFLKSGIDFAIITAGMPRVDIWVQEFLRNEVPCVVADYFVDYVCKPGYSLEKHVQYNTHTWAEKSLQNLIARVEQEEYAEDVQTPDDHGTIDDIACQACERRDRGDEMLICGDEDGIEGCGIGMHIDCLNPPLDDVPEEDWFCPSCSRKREESMDTKQTSKKKGPKGNKH